MGPKSKGLGPAIRPLFLLHAIMHEKISSTDSTPTRSMMAASVEVIDLTPHPTDTQGAAGGAGAQFQRLRSSHLPPIPPDIAKCT